MSIQTNTTDRGRNGRDSDRRISLQHQGYLRRTVAGISVAAILFMVSLLAFAAPRTDLATNVGLIGLSVTNLGYCGNGFDPSSRNPSCEYPRNSNVEHLFLGGLWVGAVTPDGSIRVSVGAQDASNLAAGDAVREFQDVPEDTVRIWSNSQNGRYPYDYRALATQHIEVSFNDYATVESGAHVPLGLKVVLRALAYSNPYADDFVILDYAVINISESALRDVYIGWWNDTSVGNTQITDPYGSGTGASWNWYDDKNGGWGPVDWVPAQYTVPSDPDIWMMYEYDANGEDGMATSWVGTRLLGTIPEVEPEEGQPPVSYNAWGFGHVPDEDDIYEDEDSGELTEGKYQKLRNGAFTVGETQDENYTIPSDWVALLSTGPFPYMAAGDTVHVTYAVICGADSTGLLNNAKVSQLAYDEGFSIPTGPPSPALEASFENDTVRLSWAPGDSSTTLPDGTVEQLLPDDPLRSPEYHISKVTGKLDFQGYRVFRFEGEEISDDPYSVASLVAEFDKVDGIGFDTGLPPLDAEGNRYFVDTALRDGFPYWYSVVSFSAADVEENLDSFQSGFYENGVLLYPGPAPGMNIGVYPNPYRAGGYFDDVYEEQELGRKIYFTGLPVRCRIQVFNLAGDLVKTLHHESDVLGQEPWDILSEPARAISSGLYIYVVEDLDNGDIERGKLVIIK